MATNGEDFSGVEAETSFEVHLYIYDLSKELSKSFKKILKGKPLPDIWHTGLVAYGREYYFASSGIESCRPGETILGEPDQIMTLGKTELPYSVFLEYIFALGESSYKPGTYHLLEHNCNNFSQEVSNFLTGTPIPLELRELSQEILGNKSLSNTLKEYFDKLNLRVEGSKGISFGAIGSSRAAAVSETTAGGASIKNGEPLVNGQHSLQSQQNTTQKNSGASRSKSKADPEQEQAKMAATTNGMPPEEQQQGEHEALRNTQEQAPAAGPVPDKVEEMPTTELTTQRETSAVESQQTPSNPAVDGENVAAPKTPEAQNTQRQESIGERPEADDTNLSTFTSRRSRKYQDPPLIFPDVDGVRCYNKIMETVGQTLNVEERHAMEEILEYLASPEGGAWALGSPHLDAIGRLLNDRNMPDEIPVLTLQVLESAALKEDVILLLHQDREHHHLMSYLFRIENLPVTEQEHIATFMCNLCSNTSSFDWLMYISEWMEDDGRSCNNSRVTVRVAVHSLLSDASASLQEKGAALIYNLALKELFDDTATELAMAVMQFLQANLNEELAFRCLTSLLRFMTISYNDVPALMKMLGPDVRKFNGLSDRVDELSEQIHTKLSLTTSA